MCVTVACYLSYAIDDHNIGPIQFLIEPALIISWVNYCHGVDSS